MMIRLKTITVDICATLGNAASPWLHPENWVVCGDCVNLSFAPDGNTKTES